MLKTFVKKYIKNSIFGILDQVFSSLLIFGINFYFAYKSQFNEVGIFALIFSSIGIAQILQQAILERPFLIKKNVFRYQIVIKRFLFVVLVLIISILFSFYGDNNTSSVALNDNFIIPWLFLGVVQLLFNLGRVYFYTIKKEQLAFYISFSSTSIIFSIFLLIGPLIEDQLFPYVLTICLTKTIILVLFFRKVELVDSKFISEDSSYKDYILLIFISLSIYLRTRYPIFYLAEYAFILAGIFEVFRTITELVLMPFRPISQSLLTYLSEQNSLKIKKSFLKLISTFLLIASVLSAMFYLIFDIIISYFNLLIDSSENVKFYLVSFILINILNIPFNAFLLSQKKFLYEFLVKSAPAILLVFFLSIFNVNNNIDEILLFLSFVTFIEFIIASIFSVKTLKNIQLDELI